MKHVACWFPGANTLVGLFHQLSCMPLCSRSQGFYANRVYPVGDMFANNCNIIAIAIIVIIVVITVTVALLVLWHWCAAVRFEMISAATIHWDPGPRSVKTACDDVREGAIQG